MRRTGGVLAKLAFCVLTIALILIAYFIGANQNKLLAGDESQTEPPGSVVAYVAVVQDREADFLHPEASQAPIDWRGEEVEQKTQAAMLTSTTLFSSVLVNSSLEICKTSWFKSKGSADAHVWLSKHFHAVPIKDSRLIKIYVEGASVANDARVIIEDVVNTHLDQQRSVHTSHMLDQTSVLNNLKMKFEQHIRELQDRQNNLMMHLYLGQVGSQGRYTATDLEFEMALKRQIESAAELARQQSARDLLKSQIEAKTDPPAVVEAVDRDPAIAATRTRWIELEADVAARTDAGDSQEHKQAQAKCDALRAALEKVRTDKIAELRNTFLADAEARVKSQTAAQDAIDKRIEQFKAQLADLSIAMSDYLSTTDELGATRANYKLVKDRLEEFGAANVSCAIEWAAHPELPLDAAGLPK